MTDEAKKIVDALRTDCNEQGSCPDCAANEWCHGNATKPLDDDAADLIEALSAEVEQVKQERDGLSIMLTSAESAFETVKRERDAAVEDLRGYCNVCAHWNCGFMEDACEDCKHSHPFDDDTFESDNWQWRGVKEADDEQ